MTSRRKVHKDHVHDIEAARKVAATDPTVKAGLLSVTVTPWLAVFRR